MHRQRNVHARRQKHMPSFKGVGTVQIYTEYIVENIEKRKGQGRRGDERGEEARGEERGEEREQDTRGRGRAPSSILPLPLWWNVRSD